MALLENENININQKDKGGVNAFWISAFYNHVEIMDFLADQGINTLITN